MSCLAPTFHLFQILSHCAIWRGRFRVKLVLLLLSFTPCFSPSFACLSFTVLFLVLCLSAAVEESCQSRTEEINQTATVNVLSFSHSLVRMRTSLHPSPLCREQITAFQLTPPVTHTHTQARSTHISLNILWMVTSIQCLFPQWGGRESGKVREGERWLESACVFSFVYVCMCVQGWVGYFLNVIRYSY